MLKKVNVIGLKGLYSFICKVYDQNLSKFWPWISIFG